MSHKCVCSKKRLAQFNEHFMSQAGVYQCERSKYSLKENSVSSGRVFYAKPRLQQDHRGCFFFSGAAFDLSWVKEATNEREQSHAVKTWLELHHPPVLTKPTFIFIEYKLHPKNVMLQHRSPRLRCELEELLAEVEVGGETAWKSLLWKVVFHCCSPDAWANSPSWLDASFCALPHPADPPEMDAGPLHPRTAACTRRSHLTRSTR